MANAKGKAGEREFTDLLKKFTGKSDLFVDVHAQGADIQCIPGLAIEVKRQEVLLLDRWWWQAERQADKLGAIPVLAYRQNRKPWRVCLPGMLLGIGVTGRIECNLETFESWLRLYLKE